MHAYSHTDSTQICAQISSERALSCFSALAVNVRGEQNGQMENQNVVRGSIIERLTSRLPHASAHAWQRHDALNSLNINNMKKRGIFTKQDAVLRQ